MLWDIPRMGLDTLNLYGKTSKPHKNWYAMISRISLFYLMCVYLHSRCFADINSCDPHNKLYL